MRWRLDVSRPWYAWPPKVQAAVGLAGLVVLLGLLALQWQWQARSLLQLNERWATAQQRWASLQAKTGVMEPAAKPQPPDASDPALWPPAAAGVEVWVREAARAAAESAGVVLQRLTITWPVLDPATSAASSETAPFATMQIDARGTYAALKDWQGRMQAQMPSLAVQSLSWQGPPNDGSGLLLASWTWRLWVRPAGHGEGPEWQPQALAQAEPLRPGLAPAGRDPFSLAVQLAAPAAPFEPEPRVWEPAAVEVEPMEPPLQWTTLGILRGPDGQKRLSGHWGDESLTLSLSKGDLSPQGHRVERISDAELELVHPETRERLRFRLPPPPRFESR